MIRQCFRTASGIKNVNRKPGIVLDSSSRSCLRGTKPVKEQSDGVLDNPVGRGRKNAIFVDETY